MKNFILKTLLSVSVFFISVSGFAQKDEDILSGVEDAPQKQYINNAFKSSRVINGHSIEFIGKGVLDTRVLHRFGEVKSGFNNLFGLDQANMRFGFDYGVTKDLTVGVGRSNVGKEWDGFVKYRLVQQSVGGKHASPVSIVLISGVTTTTTPWADPSRKNFFTSRMGFYNELIIGRKFSEAFSLQLAPTQVHLNLVPYDAYKNDIFAIGLGGRYKLSKRTAFVVDYHFILRPINGDDDEGGSFAATQFNQMKNPLSIGFDIETGGHVFQLHFSNSTGMNEKAFITNTNKSWGKGEVGFGFNLSRVFTVKHK